MLQPGWLHPSNQISLLISGHFQELGPQRNIQLCVQLLALHNKVDNIVIAAPEWEITGSLEVISLSVQCPRCTTQCSDKVNIKTYCMLVMLSPALDAYKGDLPITLVLVSKPFPCNATGCY